MRAGNHNRAGTTSPWSPARLRTSEPEFAYGRLGLADELLDRLAVVEQVLRPAGAVFQRRRVRIDPHMPVDRRQHLLDVDRPGLDVGAVLGAGADHLTVPVT